MKQEKRNTWSRWLAAAVFACSFALLSFYQIIRDETWVVAVTVVVALPCGFFLYKKTGEETLTYLKSRPKTAVMLLAIAVVLAHSMHQAKGILQETIPYWLFTIPAVFYLLTWLVRKLRPFLQDLWAKLDQRDRRLYFWATVVLSCLVLLFYKLEPQWYLQYDKVYSIDSGWVYKNLYPQMAYYDIRHPILSVITFPLWAFTRSALGVFAPAHLLDGLCVACVQLINVQLLLLTGAMVAVLSRNRWTFPLYLVCLPTLTFSMFFEKYQICVFLLVLYAYLLCQKKEGTELGLTLAVGAMPTSVLLFADELLIDEPFSQKVKRALRTAACGALVLVCAGRGYLLNPMTLLSEAGSKAQNFGLRDMSMGECMNAFVNMIHGAFLPLATQHGERYLWTNVTQGASLIGYAILAVLLIGVVAEHKDSFVKLCTVWTAAGFILLGVFQWGVWESPLFSIYFAWALVPLFQKGLQCLVDGLNWREEIFYPVVLTTLLIVNAWALLDIGGFLTTL